MFKYILAASIFVASVIPALAQHHPYPHARPHSIPVPPHRPSHLGRNLGLGAVGLGLLGTAIILNQRPPDECIIGYDRFRRPVYDNECME